MRRRLLFAFAASAALLAGHASALTYNVINVSTVSGGISISSVNGINSSGQVAVNTSGGSYVYSYPSGTETPLVVPIIPNGGNTNSINISGINNAGTLVGSDIQTTNGVGNVFDFDGFIDQGGTFTFLNGPTGSVATQILGVNNSGEVWGLYNTASGNGVQPYFVYSGGVYTVLSHSGYSNLTITGIDDAGDIVGNATVGGVNVGYIDSGGVFTVIRDPLSDGRTSITTISDNGLIAGNYFSSGLHNVGFEYDAGTFTDIAPLGSTNVSIGGINDSGEVVGSNGPANFFTEQGGVYTSLVVPGNLGQGLDGPGLVTSINDAGIVGGDVYSGPASQDYTAFIAVPQRVRGVPEPATWSLMISGAAMLGAAMRRRRVVRAA